MIKNIGLIFVCFLTFTCNKNTSKYNIVEYGATTDTSKCNTEAINKAIIACNADGGGIVRIPKGIFISGTIKLLSNVTLFLDNGAVLKGSNDTSNYDKVNGRRYGLIVAKNCKNITIEGKGIIDGNGTYFFDATLPHLGGGGEAKYTRQGVDFQNPKYGWQDGPIKYSFRPGMMLVLSKCENVKIKDVTLIDSPEWTTRIANCDNVEISGIFIKSNLLVPNSDGLHFTNSRNVIVSNCDIRCGDDAIIVSGFDDLVGVHGEVGKADNSSNKIGNLTNYSENIVVSNCVLQSRSAGIRIGYGEHHIRNCVFSNIVIYDSNRGIGVFARDTANIENIQFSNIIIQTRLHKGSWWGKGEPIHVSVIAQNAKNPVGYIKNIQFININMTAETGVIVYNDEAGKLDNVQFSNCTLWIKKSPIDSIYGGNIDLRPTQKPEQAIYKSDIPGFLISNVSNLKMNNIDLQWDNNLAEYFTHGIHLKNVSNGYIYNFNGTGATSKFKNIFMENSKVSVKN